MSNEMNWAEVADQEFDARRFADACDAYRRALENGEITTELVVNLSTARQEEWSAFWRGLANKYPANMEYRRAEIQQLKLPAHRVTGWTELLKLDHTPKETLMLRLARLGAAADSGRLEYFVEDFVAIWDPDPPVKDSRVFRPILASIVCRLHSPQSLATLDALAKLATGDVYLDADWEDFSAILAAKKAEIQRVDQMRRRAR